MARAVKVRCAAGTWSAQKAVAVQEEVERVVGMGDPVVLGLLTEHRNHSSCVHLPVVQPHVIPFSEAAATGALQDGTCSEVVVQVVCQTAAAAKGRRMEGWALPLWGRTPGCVSTWAMNASLGVTNP